MTLSPLPLLLAFSALTTCTIAGDNLSSQTTSSQADAGPHRTAPLLGLSLAGPNGDVCYAMRTYKVRPTERIREHENFFRGYSECEMASNFQIRSAEAHEKKPHPDEPPAALK